MDLEKINQEAATVQTCDFIYTTINKSGDPKMNIEIYDFINFLTLNGFHILREYNQPISDKPAFIRVQNNIARMSSINEIKEFTLEFVSTIDNSITSFLMSKSAGVFNYSILTGLKPRTIKKLRDTKTTCFMYFQDVALKITSEGYERIPYEDLDGIIWKDQILAHNCPENIGEAREDSSGVTEYLERITPEGGDPRAFESSIGYLVHRYKNPAVTKAIILQEDTIFKGDELGRTGKGIFQKIVKAVTSTTMFGKGWNPTKSFAWSGIELDTDVVIIDDLFKGFQFDTLFSAIAEEIEIERKGEDTFSIPYRDSPKFVMSTNYILKGNSQSFKDRRHDLFFSNFFPENGGVNGYFGFLFFEDWNPEQWNDFYNTIARCITLYLKKGLVTATTNSMSERTFLAETSASFAQYVEESTVEQDWQPGKK